LIGRTRANVGRERRLVQEFPGIGAIQPTNPSCLNDRGIKVAEVYAHPFPAPRDWLPVRYATTRGASTQPKALVTPDVTVDGSLSSGDLNLARFVVTPYPRVPATDRAVAACKAPRLSFYLDSDCTTVTGTCEHGTASCAA